MFYLKFINIKEKFEFWLNSQFKFLFYQTSFLAYMSKCTILEPICPDFLYK